MTYSRIGLCESPLHAAALRAAPGRRDRRSARSRAKVSMVASTHAADAPNEPLYWRLQAPSRQGASSGDSRRLYSGAPRAVGREMATTFFSGGARSTEGAKVTISRKVLGAAFARPPAAALRATTLAPAAPFSLLLWALGACGAVFLSCVGAPKICLFFSTEGFSARDRKRSRSCLLL